MVDTQVAVVLSAEGAALHTGVVVVDLTVVSLLPDQAGTSSVTVMFLMFALPYFHKVIPGALTNKKTCQNQTNGIIKV